MTPTLFFLNCPQTIFQYRYSLLLLVFTFPKILSYNEKDKPKERALSLGAVYGCVQRLRRPIELAPAALLQGRPALARRTKSTAFAPLGRLHFALHSHRFDLLRNR